MSKRWKKKQRVLSDSECVSEVQKCLRARLCPGVLPTKLLHVDEERRQLLDLVRRTAVHGESHSVLIVGPRGAGKTTLLKSVLAEVQEEKAVRENLMQVHLNGWMQTDDRIALKEIALQLHLDNVIRDKVFGSFSENLTFLLEALKSGERSKTRPVLFVLEEFDLFAQHKNQTLLYNLFDISQSAQTPIAVVGLTCRLDILELLEKRVKSRFSHRQIILFPNTKFAHFLECTSRCLTLPDTFPDPIFACGWNKNELCEHDAAASSVFRLQFTFSRDFNSLNALLMLALCQLNASESNVTASMLEVAEKQLSADSQTGMLNGVSMLELCLIIATKHVDDIYNGTPFNFQMVYSDYQQFIQRKSFSVLSFEKPVVMKAFERLQQLNFIQPVEGAAGRGQREFQLMRFLLNDLQIQEALQNFPQCPTDLRLWASSSLN
uniref:origin recognition complex subunit 4 isoform X1 n=1 Tax=Myxine glutinosa TaxID=7769 RepID=UPI003590162C